MHGKSNRIRKASKCSQAQRGGGHIGVPRNLDLDQIVKSKLARTGSNPELDSISITRARAFRSDASRRTAAARGGGLR